MKKEKGFYIQQYHNKWRIGEYSFLNDDNSTVHFRGWEVGKNCIQASCFETSDTYFVNAIKKNPLFPISIELWERVKSIITNLVHDIKDAVQIQPSHPFDIKYGQCYYCLTECNLDIGRFRLPYEQQMPLVDSAYILDLREEDWFLSILQDKMGLPDYENLIQLNNCIYDDCIKRIENTTSLLLHSITTSIPKSKENMVKEDLSLQDYLNSKVTKEELKNAWMDEFRVKYSADRKRLLENTNWLEDYNIQEGTKVICDDAFRRCDELISINIPNSVVTIGDNAFMICRKLSKIIIPESVTHIGKNAFSYCSSFTSISIPSNISDIGDYAFAFCESLKSIIVDKGNFNYDSRNNCNAIIETSTNKLKCGCKATIIPESVTSIGIGAFYGCDAITSIFIPKSITFFEESAFENCHNLASITFPHGLVIIGERAFLNCENLTTINIPNGVSNIGEKAFAGCSKLNSIVVEESNDCYDSRDNCNAIIETSTNTIICGCAGTCIPLGVASIGNGAFYNCWNLIDITIPHGVKSIGNDAFYGCESLTFIVIPNGLTFIGNNAFECCFNLSSIYIPDSVTSIGKNVFGFCDNLTSIFIPSGSIDKFVKLLPEYKDKLIEQ